MVERCNAVGVNVMADLVINHMSGHGMSGTGSGGSGFDGNSLVRISLSLSLSVFFHVKLLRLAQPTTRTEDFLLKISPSL